MSALKLYTIASGPALKIRVVRITFPPYSPPRPFRNRSSQSSTSSGVREGWVRSFKSVSLSLRSPSAGRRMPQRTAPGPVLPERPPARRPELTTVQFRADRPSRLRRAAMASSAVRPSRTKRAVTGPNAPDPGCPGGELSKYTPPACPDPAELLQQFDELHFVIHGFQAQSGDFWDQVMAVDQIRHDYSF